MYSRSPTHISPPLEPEEGIEDSDDEEWHDAADQVLATDTSAPAVIDPVLREADLKEALKQANELKARGNDLFRESDWQRAFEVYTDGLHCLPRRIEQPKDIKGKGRAPDGDELNEPLVAQTPELNDDEPHTPLTLIEQQCAVIRSILNSNIAACHVKMGDLKTAVACCTESLSDVPTYIKALHRRATSNDSLGTWASLSDAEKDYQVLLDTLPITSTLLPSIRNSLRALKPRLQKAQQAETDEMMGKLKGLGNSILGNFGLSTDNFQFTPNGSGGYSMNFTQ